MNRLTLGGLAALLLAGCAAIKVQKAAPGVEGVRYSLPQPFLLVTPRTDGGVDVEVLYLPDPDNEYAIDNWSFFASNKLDVAVSMSGMLTKLVLESDATAFAAQTATSAGEVGSKVMDARVAAEKARREKLAAARQAVEDAKTEQAVAEAEYATAGDDAKAAALTKLKVAEARLQRAVERLGWVKSSDAANDPQASRSHTLPGPVLFRIVEDARTKGVKLESVSFVSPTSSAKQPSFQTHKIKEKEPPVQPRAPTKLTFVGAAEVAWGGSLKLKFSRAVHGVKSATLNGPSGTAITLGIAPQTDGMELILSLPPAPTGAKPGAHDLEITFSEWSGDRATDVEVVFNVIVKP